MDGTSQALNEYNEYSQTQREYIQGLASLVSADVSRLESLTSGLNAHAGYVGAWNDAEASKADARNMVNIANADLATRQSTLAAQAAAAQAQIDAGWYAAQASAAASQAQALLGVVGTSVSLQGNLSVQDSSQETASTSYSGSYTRGWSKSRQYTEES
jgi:hypothetical protein